MRDSRRRFLMQAATGSGLLMAPTGLGPLLGPVSAAETQLPSDAVAFTPDIEPLVRLLEETPRDSLVETMAQRVQRGLSYREVVAALLLAGVRNVQPRPSVGFKFHAVLVVNSAHLASLASPATDRWLPIFWALDYFKSSQARDVREGNWTMAAVNETAVPSPEQSASAFREAMEAWDVEQADAAVAGLTRGAGAHEVFAQFSHYGVRDFRSIGHKAIFVANAWRTLQCIGWRHAEPVMRSLAYALLNHEGEPNPAQSDLQPDQPFRANQSLAETIRADWRSGKPDAAAAQELVRALRTAGWQDACQQAAEMLNRGVAPQSVYDALFSVAGELLMRQPGIVALHAVTSTNAMHYLYTTAADDRTRRLILLQNVAFLPLFREAMRNRGDVADRWIDELTPADGITGDEQSLETIFASLSQQPQQASQQVLAYLNQGGDAQALIRAARQLIFLKGTDSHDYKFSSAVLEDYYHVDPALRNAFLAAAVHKLRGAGEPDNQLAHRIRDALTTS